MSSRRISKDDYGLILMTLSRMEVRLKASGRKALYNYLDVEEAMISLYAFEHAYIVAESYLVVFEVAIPWYSNTIMLNELLVLCLDPGCDFRVVPDFLEAQAVDAGAKLVCTGTALAKSDDALASLYTKSGYAHAARMLIKEI